MQCYYYTAQHCSSILCREVRSAENLNNTDAAQKTYRAESMLCKDRPKSTGGHTN